MTEPLIREYRPGDVPRLRELWRGAFGRPDSLTDALFRLLPDMGTALVAAEGERLIGAVCVIVGLELADCGRKPPVCGYICGLAVAEDRRGHGVGSALARAAALKAREREAGLICALPTQPSLYRWCEERLGIERALFRQRREVASAPVEPVMRLSSTEYMLWRESMLRGRARLRPSNPTLEFARLCCEGMGGGLFACGSGICAAGVSGSVAVLRELVSMDGSACGDIAASVGALLGAERAVYCLPAADGEPYIAATPGTVPSDCVWDLSFD